MAVNNIEKELTLLEANNSYKLCYTWTIHNFSCCKKETGQYIESPLFYAGVNGKYKWHLVLYPKGKKQDGFEYLSIYIKFTTTESIEIVIHGKMSILNDKKMTYYSADFGLCKFNQNSCTWGFSNFMKRSTVLDAANGLLPNDELTIVCDMFIVDSNTRTAVENNSKECEKELCHQYLDNVSHFFESPEFCDVTLATSGQEFKAHKVILAAQSPVFMAMFKNKMKEQEENRVDITDVDDQVLNEMLRFIYTGKTTDLDKIADGLLAAANKYELKILEGVCEKSLCENLTIENAASRLILADFYGAVQLKTQSLDFISRRTREVLDTADYQTILKTYPHLIDAILRTVLTKKNQLTGSTDCRLY